MIKPLMLQYPLLDRLQAETIVACWENGTLSEILAQPQEPEAKPESLVIKTLTVEHEEDASSS